jgi:hypothetical protein
MPCYRINVCSTVFEYRTVELEAETECAAATQAIERICNPDLPDVPIDKSDSAGHEAIEVEEVA